MRAWQIIQTLSVVQVMGPVKDQEVGTATIDTSIIRSFLAFHSATGQMNGWMRRTRKRQNLRRLTAESIPCMKQNKGNAKWRQP